MRAGVSIVICTYNGSSLLPETLRHIAQQQVRADILWQLIVVDNASTDNTAQVIRDEWGKYEVSALFTPLYQPKPGLSHARAMGIENAVYEYILFCDDDNWLNPEYVNTAYDLMQKHPAIGVLGGHGELVYETKPPAWAAALPLFANGAQEVRSGKVLRKAVYGAGCILRKSVYEAILRAGFQPLLSDRKGAVLSSGGDYEICYAFVLAGYEIWYDERLTFKHFMTANRQTWEYYVRFLEQRAQSFEVLIPYSIFIRHGSRNLWSFHFVLLRLILSSLKMLFPPLINKMRLAPDSDAGKLNALHIQSRMARIKSYGRYRAIKKNFLRISAFKRENLKNAPHSTPRLNPVFSFKQ